MPVAININLTELILMHANSLFCALEGWKFAVVIQIRKNNLWAGDSTVSVE